MISILIDTHADGLNVTDDSLFFTNSGMIAETARKNRLIAIGNLEFAQAGGMIGYGVNIPDLFYRAAAFVDKILKGEKPGDIPVEQATKFVTIVNLKVAKAMGIDVPTSLLLRADEVIE